MKQTIGKIKRHLIQSFSNNTFTILVISEPFPLGVEVFVTDNHFLDKSNFYRVNKIESFSYGKNVDSLASIKYKETSR